MDQLEEENSRISLIQTHWSEILDAHDGVENVMDAVDAQAKVLQRYGGCIYRYIYGATRDYNVADDLAQEFAYRFVRGDFRNADPAKGRFRDYLKTALRNLINDYFRKQKKDGVSLEQNQFLVANLHATLADEFVEGWRGELLSRVWSALKDFEDLKSNYYYTVLRFRADHPKLGSVEIAQSISQQINLPVSADWIRQKLHRARGKFAEFLRDEVRSTLPGSTDVDVDNELAELHLLQYLES